MDTVKRQFHLILLSASEQPLGQYLFVVSTDNKRILAGTEISDFRKGGYIPQVSAEQLNHIAKIQRNMVAFLFLR